MTNRATSAPALSHRAYLGRQARLTSSEAVRLTAVAARPSSSPAEKNAAIKALFSRKPRVPIEI